jgi:acetylcholinesterase
VPECAAHAKGGAFACLQRASLNTSELMAATGIAVSTLPTEQYAFLPTFDGPSGVYPLAGSLKLASGNWSKIPFITGCNKDEGTAFITAPQFTTNDSARIDLLSNFTPSLIPVVGKALLQYDVEQLLKLYPNDPTVGAPFGTGNQTFGLDPAYKQLAALSMCPFCPPQLNWRLTHDGSDRRQLPLGTAPLPAVRRLTGRQVLWLPLHRPRRVPRADVRRSVFPASSDGLSAHSSAVTHSTEVTYVYGVCPPTSQACQVMTDYWISFATSLDPNDQKGVMRPQWPSYSQTAPVR